MDEDDDLPLVLEELWNRIDDAAGSKDPDHRKQGVEAATRELEALAAERPSAPVLYSLGYALYVHPSRPRSPFLQGRIEKVLGAAVEMDPGYARAWLYLGHNAYDRADYGLALHRFSQIQPEDLPPYLRLKAEEMGLCCFIRLNGSPATLDALERFVSRAEGHPAEDIWPHELARTLQEVIPRLDASQRARLELLARRLDKAGRFGSWFAELLEAK